MTSFLPFSHVTLKESGENFYVKFNFSAGKTETPPGTVRKKLRARAGIVKQGPPERLPGVAFQLRTCPVSYYSHLSTNVFLYCSGGALFIFLYSRGCVRPAILDLPHELQVWSDIIFLT